MKSYTDLEQSKKLAEILPIESADYHYIVQGEKSYFYPYSLSSEAIKQYNKEIKYIPCWSLTALLDVLSYPSLHKLYIGWRCDTYNEEGEVQQMGEDADNPVDACYEMIIKLHELNLL